MSVANIVRQYSGAADRNKDPILSVLKQFMKQENVETKLCLEISSGTGQHVSYFSKYFPFITFQPSEFDVNNFGSITSFISDCPNVLPPKFLDASQDFSSWIDGSAKPESYDYVINVNMIHISEYRATIGLFKGCGAVLKTGGLLFTYGPYADNKVITPDSNVRFNAMLKNEHPDWGLRDITLQLIPLAKDNGLHLFHKENLPANNKCLVWKKQ